MYDLKKEFFQRQNQQRVQVLGYHRVGPHVSSLNIPTLVESIFCNSSVPPTQPKSRQLLTVARVQHRDALFLVLRLGWGWGNRGYFSFRFCWLK
ncbi:unnamed protein product [Nesidiocoris tenuis]|uniref:Uncharacterized protein n=1 Tax=Nesidiocoris tenuis TaxID=355587 RepID=A0A6H5HXY3_9HEMI|nr:unnamed protein product [Nesidiocoris tenuis]